MISNTATEWVQLTLVLGCFDMRNKNIEARLGLGNGVDSHNGQTVSTPCHHHDRHQSLKLIDSVLQVITGMIPVIKKDQYIIPLPR